MRPEAQKDDLYDKLAELIRLSRRSDTVVPAGDSNAVGKINASQACLGGLHALRSQLFLSSTNFRYNSERTVTWRSASTGTPNQIDHSNKLPLDDLR
ncbi:unnamed protein product [Echinostoma caproni]|uniref:Uncharacterized protein n=1 Tax=Echinostoma caproni TaxID=27848 RepID=A0A183B9Y1_9TREM|nr:unnamed protein product [Echinostoma caproni]